MSKTKTEIIRRMVAEKSLMLDRSDPKWAHPLARDNFPPQLGADQIDNYDPDVPLELKKQVRDKMIEGLHVMLGGNDLPWQKFYAKGCPEEPDAPDVEIRIAIPAGEHKKPLPIIFAIAAGGLVLIEPSLFVKQYTLYQQISNAIIVAPVYRGCLDAPYPAAVNDLHAAYAWTVEHAAEFGGDPDNIVLTGGSSGGHLGLCLPFRLKRYGFKPKGVVVNVPITDDRLSQASSRIYFEDSGDGRNDWDGFSIHQYAAFWMGESNFASQFVGPEAFANHATVEDCKGLCPVFIAENEWDPDRDNNLALVQKLLKAGVYVEYHLLPGLSHSTLAMASVDPGIEKLASAHDTEMANAIDNFLKYDCRRPWTADE